MSEKHIPTPRTLFGFRLRTLAALVVIALVSVIALGADLASEGLVYDLFWQTTGESEPLDNGQFMFQPFHHGRGYGAISPPRAAKGQFAQR